jgi:hypothetical protein
MPPLIATSTQESFHTIVTLANESHGHNHDVPQRDHYRVWGRFTRESSTQGVQSKRIVMPVRRTLALRSNLR